MLKMSSNFPRALNTGPEEGTWKSRRRTVGPFADSWGDVGPGKILASGDIENLERELGEAGDPFRHDPHGHFAMAGGVACIRWGCRACGRSSAKVRRMAPAPAGDGTLVDRLHVADLFGTCDRAEAPGAGDVSRGDEQAVDGPRPATGSSSPWSSCRCR